MEQYDLILHSFLCAGNWQSNLGLANHILTLMLTLINYAEPIWGKIHIIQNCTFGSAE